MGSHTNLPSPTIPLPSGAYCDTRFIVGGFFVCVAVVRGH